MKISAVLRNVQLLCVETAPFIYFVESHPTYVDKMRDIFQEIRGSQAFVVTSTVTLTEVLTKPLASSDTALMNTYRQMLLHSRGITLLPIDAAIAERAATLRARYGLKTPDALQVATAIESNCDALTNDKGIQRVKEIAVLVLDDLERDI
jgi:predicted nucleic acid-binding protein